MHTRCFDCRRKTPRALGNSWTRGRLIAECDHQLVPMEKIGIVRAFGHNTCAVCYKGVSTAKGVGSRCEECKLNVHTFCHTRMPMPCLPTSSFPVGAFNTKKKYALVDFCPHLPPFIPALLIRCIYELEYDRLNFEGLYRIPGDQTKIDRLLKEFNENKFVPKLNNEQTETITSCIKQFLIRLKVSNCQIKIFCCKLLFLLGTADSAFVISRISRRRKRRAKAHQCGLRAVAAKSGYTRLHLPSSAARRRVRLTKQDADRKSRQLSLPDASRRQRKEQRGGDRGDENASKSFARPPHYAQCMSSFRAVAALFVDKR